MVVEKQHMKSNQGSHWISKKIANNISIHFYMQYSYYWLSLPVAGRGSVRARPHLCLVMFNAQERSKGSRWSRTCYLSPATQGILITRVWFENVRWNHPASNRQSNSEMACWLKKFWNVAMSLPAARCHARNKPFFLARLPLCNCCEGNQSGQGVRDFSATPLHWNTNRVSKITRTIGGHRGRIGFPRLADRSVMVCSMNFS